MADKKKTVVFCCENSGYKAAELVQSPDLLNSVELIRLPCSGKIEAGLVLKCLESGHPGVIVLGCPYDNCKFIKGNYRAKKRIDMVKENLKNAGLDTGRVYIDFISSVDSYKFIAIVKEFNGLYK
ncbi:MAG: hydrogenase iron-sulfur subunit [Spirochaetota bacterium]